MAVKRTHTTSPICAAAGVVPICPKSSRNNLLAYHTIDREYDLIQDCCWCLELCSKRQTGRGSAPLCAKHRTLMTTSSSLFQRLHQPKQTFPPYYNMPPILYAIIGVIINPLLGPVTKINQSSLLRTAKQSHIFFTSYLFLLL